MSNRTIAWQQLTLEPPPVVELTLRIGVLSTADHVQYQVEARDVTNGNLIAMWSLPWQRSTTLEKDFSQAAMELLKLVHQYVGPF